jgi:hypothetical protein
MWLNTLGSIASIIGTVLSLLVYIKVLENKRFYIGRRYLEINKKRISEILSISDDKRRCTSSVKKELESILNFYKQNYLLIFRNKRERKVIKELERLVQENGDTLPAIKQNLKLLLASLESEDI